MDFIVRNINDKWFADSAPKNYKESSAILGSGTNGKVTIYKTNEISTDDLIDVVVASSASQPLKAEIVDDGIKITLGTTSAATPTADDTKNTAKLIAQAVNALDGYTADYSGTGATAISQAVSDKDFTDGQYGTPCPMAGLTLLSGTTYYVSTKADMGKTNDGWRSFSLTTY